MLGTRHRLLTSAPLRAALAAGAAVAVLTGCGGGSGTSTASGSSSAPPPTSTSAAPPSASAAAAGSDFCTQARSFATDAGQAVSAGTSNPDFGGQLQSLVARLQAITPPPAIASDWQSATAALAQFAQAYQGVNLNDPQQLQQLQQKVLPLTQQLATSGTRIEQYLQTQCGISTGSTDTASPTS